MRHKKIIFSALLLSGLALTELYTQDAIPGTGGDVSGNGGTVSYSVGQLVDNTNTGTNGIVTHGVQQPYEIFVIPSAEEIRNSFLQCTVYPNPATDFLILKINYPDRSLLTFSLYDISGSLLEHKPVEGNETLIPMGERIPSVYFLKVDEGNEEVKTFKIIKN